MQNQPRNSQTLDPVGPRHRDSGLRPSGDKLLRRADGDRAPLQLRGLLSSRRTSPGRRGWSQNSSYYSEVRSPSETSSK